MYNSLIFHGSSGFVRNDYTVWDTKYRASGLKLGGTMSFIKSEVPSGMWIVCTNEYVHEMYSMSKPAFKLRL